MTRPFRRGARHWAPWLALVLGLVAVAVLAGPPSSDGLPLDPRSPGPSGTLALVESLRGLGADVGVQSVAPGPGDTTALILADNLDVAGRQALGTWVEAGGTLVLADPTSPLAAAEAAGAASFGSLEPELVRGCGLGALGSVDHVNVPGAILFKVPAGATACFPGPDRGWLVVVARGRGHVVMLGGPGAFTNAALGKADNALLAVSLLSPTAAGRVVILQPPAPGEGRKGLGALVAPQVKLALAQLVAAFVVVTLARGRRLGQPEIERQPVELAGSELAEAVGQLLARSRGRGRARAAEVLRAELRRTVSERVGLPPDTAAGVVAEVVAGRTAMSAAEVEQALVGPAPNNEESLVRLAQAIEGIRREVTGLGSR